MDNARTLRALKNLKEAISSALLKNDMMHVSLKDAFISADLRHLKVEVTSFIEKDQDKLINSLNKKKHLFLDEIKRKVAFKYMPSIMFIKDRHKSRIETMEEVMASDKF